VYVDTNALSLVLCAVFILLVIGNVIDPVIR
jgi:hypothetical protein